MSNTTEPTRSNSGSSRRRRSRGGKNRSQSNRDGHYNDRNDRDRSSRQAEEFRPKQIPRSQGKAPAPKQPGLWQRILKAIGLGKEPAPQNRQEKSYRQETKAPKSNVRNARTDERKPEKSESNRPPRRERSQGDRPRGGDGSTVESNRVYVGNLSYDVSEQDLQELFKGIGTVRGVEIVYNRSTHRSKGYGFVEMVRKDEAVNAVEVLHDQFFMGRKLIVSGAKSKGSDHREDDEPVVEEKVVSLAPLPEEMPATTTEENNNPPTV
ncbi:MAG: RNA-binding protein [Verrucomicrobiota bacterium]